MDYEQPDSTTEHEVAVTNDLVSFGDESSEPVKPTEYQPPAKEEVQNEPPKPKAAEKVSSPTVESKKIAEQDEGCPVCHFIDYVGQVTPSPVYDILVWKEVYTSAAIFFTVLPLLVLYSYCNPIVVTAYLLLGLVTSTFTYRVYRYIVDSFQKSETNNPFIGFADLDVDSSRQMVLQWADRVLPIFINLVNKLKHYILVQDILDTAKFAVVLYVTAVIGGYFSLRLLAILGFTGAFTLPKVFALYKPQITETFENIHKIVKANIKLAKHKVREVKDQVMSQVMKKRN